MAEEGLEAVDSDSCVTFCFLEKDTKSNASSISSRFALMGSPRDTLGDNFAFSRGSMASSDGART